MCFELHNTTSVYSQNTGWRYERFGCIWLHHVLHPRRFVAYSIRGPTTSCRSHANCIAHITCMEFDILLTVHRNRNDSLISVWPCLNVRRWKIRVHKRFQASFFSAFCCTRGLCRRQADSQWDGGRWSTKSFKDSEVHCVGVFGQMSDSHGWSIDNEEYLECYWITFDERVWIKNPDQMPSSDASNHELGSGPCGYPEVWVVVKRNGPHHQQVNKLRWLRGNSLDGINLPSQGEAGTRAKGRRVGTWDEGSCDL